MSLTKMTRPGLNTDEAARILGVTPRRVRELVAEGKLDAMEMLPRLWWYSFDAVERCRIALLEEKK